jgi:hypothetical protein
MERMPNTRRLFVPALAALLVAAWVGVSHARIWPAWSFAGPKVLQISPGFTNLAGAYSFALGDDGTAALALNYDAKARLGASGLFTSNEGDPTLFALLGSYSVDKETGVQHVRLVDALKNPRFVFEGDVAEDAMSIVGTFQRGDGFLAIAGEESGPLTLTRTSGSTASAFPLTIATRMDDRGRLFGAPTTVDGKTVESRASATLYGTHFVVNHFEDNAVSGGRIRGWVRTRANGTSVGLMTITGPNWRARFTGPVDAAGFHALCDFTAGGFVIRKLPITIPVVPGPTPPPPPGGVKPPPNLLTAATATIVNGAVTINAVNVPSRFFGAPAGLRIEFPLSDWSNTINGHAIVHADPSNASTPAPNARRCIVTVGGVTYGTATAPADVKLDIDRLEIIEGGFVQLLATGTVVSTTGRKKTVDVLVKATVQ